ncbi:hypothetical protein PR048_030248, partial [Dryococelus australis]
MTSNIFAGFRAMGIYLFDPDVIPCHAFGLCEVTEVKTLFKGSDNTLAKMIWFCYICSEDRVEDMIRCSICDKYINELCAGVEKWDTIVRFKCPECEENRFFNLPTLSLYARWFLLGSIKASNSVKSFLNFEGNFSQVRERRLMATLLSPITMAKKAFRFWNSLQLKQENNNSN